MQIFTALSLLIPALICVPTRASTITSAGLGAEGRASGIEISNAQFLGWRFHIDQDVEVTSVGGHLFSEGSVFAAVVRLKESSALPSGGPFDSTTVASAVFQVGFPSQDVLIPLRVTLPAGDYALVFGAGRFGSPDNSEGGVPTSNLGPFSGSMIIWYDPLGNDSPIWQQVDLQGPRFVVVTTPEPNLAIACGMAITLMLVGIRRRNH